MWPNGALADMLIEEVPGTRIEDLMSEYDEYLTRLGHDLEVWSVSHLAAHLECPNRKVRGILDAMKNTEWAEEFDRMHMYLDEKYGPELADLFNVHNFLALT